MGHFQVFKSCKVYCLSGVWLVSSLAIQILVLACRFAPRTYQVLAEPLALCGINSERGYKRDRTQCDGLLLLTVDRR